MLSKIDAVNELVQYDHVFLTPEGVRQLGEPFGVYHTYMETDTRSRFKGLNLGDKYKEGDQAEGCAAHILAMKICQKEGVRYEPKFGIGSQLRECCRALLEHLQKG